MASFSVSDSSLAIEFQEGDMDKYLQQLQSYTFIQEKASKPFYEMRSFMKVRGVNVPVTEMSIFQFYDAPYYYRDYLYKTDLKELKYIDTEEILRFLTEGKEMWTYWMGIVIPETFNQVLMTPKAKMWMKFVPLRIWLTIEMSKISSIQAIITYGILQKKQICIGTW
ncbi:hypothetical protein Gotur_018616, partial [Gossypium turneri]